MLELAFENKHLVIVGALLVMVISIVAILRLPVDILPAYKTSAVQILTLYPGMPAEVMEKDITSRLERWTGQSDGIERQESKSMIGVSIVKDFFRPEVDPNTAMSQVTSLAMSDLYYLPPGTVPPMVMPFDPTATIPLALLAVSSDSLSEKELYDIAYFQLRNLLGSVQGIIAPAVYGGKLRRIYIYVLPEKLQAYNLSQIDVMEAVQKSNVMIPTGDINIGALNYSVNANGMLPKVDDFNQIMVKMDPNGAPIYLKDIGYAKDSNAIQTNIVHIDGKRQVYIPIYKRPRANTIAAVEAVKSKLAELKDRLPKSINLNVILDQSAYVRNSINGLLKEGLIGLVMVSLALLFFLGNFRSTLIVVLSIPLSIMFSLIGLYFTGETINIMTLGGIALVIGLLVDDSIVVLENIDKHLKMGKDSDKAAYDGAKEVAMPVLVTTITICIVFFPIVFLTGVAKYLFTPLAIVICFAMIGSRIFSMTLVPIAAAALFRNHSSEEGVKGVFRLFHWLIQGVTRVYLAILNLVLFARWFLIVGVCVLFWISIGNFVEIGRELFPQMDVGQMQIDVRVESGTRIEKTEEIITGIERFIRDEIGVELNIIVSNMGVLNDWPAAYTSNSGTQDTSIAIQLKEGYQTPTFEYVKRLRKKLKDRFPGVQFIFNTGGIVTTALNFGLPSPIDIQITGNDLYKSREIAEKVRDMVRNIDGTEDVRIQQRYDHPEVKVEIDRDKASRLGISAGDIVKNTVAALNSTVNFKPSFWIDENNGNHYFVGVTYPEFELDDPHSLKNISLTGLNGGKTSLLGNVAKTTLHSAPIEVNHLNIQRVTDVFANVEGRDIAAVAAEIEKNLRGLKNEIPEGYKVRISGEVQSMKESFGNLYLGLALAIILVYLVIVPLLRSFALPLIIIAVVPLGLIGVSEILLATGTYLNIQSLMGIIMMVGITVSYSNLLVDKMNNLLNEGKELREVVLDASANRFRPIIMTAIVAVCALLPMSLGYEIGGEANVPLARAIIGGVLAATFLSLFVVPSLFFIFNRSAGSKTCPIKVIALILISLHLLGCRQPPPEAEKNTRAPIFADPLEAGGEAAKSASPPDEKFPKTGKSVERNVPTVLVAPPEKHEFSSFQELSGSEAPNQRVKIFAMANGFLRTINGDIGDFVKRDQTLGTLENPELFQQKGKAEAELRAKRSIYERLKRISEKTPQLTTISDVEKAQAEFEISQAQVNAINTQIGFLQLKAPFSGVIVNRFADRGAAIQNGMNNSNALPLFELQDVGTIRVIVDVPETTAPMIEIGTPCEVSFPELPFSKQSASVTRTAFSMNESTKTMPVEIDILNTDLKIRPGMYAKVRLKLQGRNAVFSVPNEAIGNVKGQTYLFRIENNVLKKMNVKLGLRDENFSEILDSVLTGNELFVIRGKEVCTDGGIANGKRAETPPKMEGK